MLSTNDLDKVAGLIKSRLNGQAFLTLPRADITELMRIVSGSAGTRLTGAKARHLSRALLERGVIGFPDLVQTSGADNIRFYHAGTVAADVATIILHPTEETDRDLAVLTTKAKGHWNLDPTKRQAPAFTPTP